MHGAWSTHKYFCQNFIIFLKIIESIKCVQIIFSKTQYESKNVDPMPKFGKIQFERLIKPHTIIFFAFKLLKK